MKRKTFQRLQATRIRSFIERKKILVNTPSIEYQRINNNNNNKQQNNRTSHFELNKRWPCSNVNVNNSLNLRLRWAPSLVMQFFGIINRNDCFECVFLFSSQKLTSLKRKLLHGVSTSFRYATRMNLTAECHYIYTHKHQRTT